MTWPGYGGLLLSSCNIRTPHLMLDLRGRGPTYMAQEADSHCHPQPFNPRETSHQRWGHRQRPWHLSLRTYTLFSKEETIDAGLENYVWVFQTMAALSEGNHRRKGAQSCYINCTCVFKTTESLVSKRMVRKQLIFTKLSLLGEGNTWIFIVFSIWSLIWFT